MKKRLRVTACGHFLEYEDGTPFFYLGDTAWELFHRLTREEADLYLTDRAKKGFTVIQAVVLAELDGLDVPNAYGDLPLNDRDPAKPNEAYFRHVDHVVNKAEELGLVIGMLPTWGRYWSSSSFAVGDHASDIIFTPENARAFGEFLGRRYRDSALIWILGGDRDVKNDDERAIIRAMAEGLAQGDGGRHLMTYHPIGPGRSSELWPDEDWLDFHMSQSSHGARDHDNGIYAFDDYRLSPAKPTVDGEPRYECMPIGFYFDGASRMARFDDFDCRQAAYWSILAGACGHTYGNNNIWQMWTREREPVLYANIPWQEALDHPGAFQMGLVRRLFASRPFTKLVPDEGKLVVDGPRHGGGKIRAGLASDGSFAIVYSPYGEPFAINKRQIRADRIKIFWFDPRYGNTHHIMTTDCKAFQTFTPPTSGRGQDWVLVLEDEVAGFPYPL